MATKILDAFFVTFGLDASGFKKGEREVNESSRRLRDENKRTFDEMEKRGKSLGQTLRGVRNETAGMFLAFMGASSLTSFISGMFQSTVASTRLGQAIGVTSERVRAWRQAVREVGGQPGDADAALSKISQDQQDWHLTGRTSSDANYKRFGITPRDLVDKDASDILLKISAAGDKMQKPEFNRRLQMMGLPQNIINLLMQGHDAVSKAIATGEKNAKVTADQEKAAQELQKNIADLQNDVANKLTPALLDLTKKATDLLNWLEGKPTGTPAQNDGSHVWGIPGLFEIKRPGGSKQTRADRNNNPGNIEDGAFARRQPGYVGGDGRFARFASPQHGFAAMEGLLGGYLRQGRDTIWSIISKWAPSSENNVGAYAAHVARLTGISANQRVTAADLPAIARAMAQHEGYSGSTGSARRYSGIMGVHQSFARHSAPGGITVNGPVTIHTRATDAKGMERDLKRGVARRASITHANTGMTP